MALYRYADQPYYFRDRAPRKTMINPSTNPMSKPTRTLFINNPSSKPSTIAKINETSPLLVLGFLCVLILKFQMTRVPEAPLLVIAIRRMAEKQGEGFGVRSKRFLFIQCNYIRQ